MKRIPGLFRHKNYLSLLIYGLAALTVLLGIGMMLEGVLNLCVALFSIKIIRHQRVDGAECRVE